VVIIVDLKKNIYLYNTGKNYMSYKFMGAHFIENNTRYVVWAPNAKSVSVVGDFNNWDRNIHPMNKDGTTGIWICNIPNTGEYSLYKYSIEAWDGNILLKSDPFAFFSELKPNTASMTYNLDNYSWNDGEYLTHLKNNKVYDKPVSIYEVNLSSWKKKDNGEYLTYIDFAHELINYVKELGFTHIELMPILEHPFDGSWGYQQTGYFSVTSRFGTPNDFKYFVDKCHENGIGVIVDWVPCHFVPDEHGLINFDGTKLYESSDSLLAENTQWGTLNFDYSKPAVKSFLISSAIFMFEQFHIDGLRVDAVAYMIYSDMAKGHTTNVINHSAVELLRELNKQIFHYFPYALMMAEESSAYPKVTEPIHDGGLGFNFKWNMGFMNDILEYFKLDPLYRKYYHKNLTFSMVYAFSENYVLPFSHDEVVHGKKSLLDKMPGDYLEKFSNLKLLYMYQYAHPGKKLMFMGGEFGQFIEWNEWKSLDWFLTDYDSHKGIQNFVKDLNHIYKTNSEFFQIERSWDGFEWVDHHNSNESMLVFKRLNKAKEEIYCIFNFTPIGRDSYWLKVKKRGKYKEILNSSNIRYFGNYEGERVFETIEHLGDYYIIFNSFPLSSSYIKYMGVN
jgi:1,4-alpha-glucan branching enzyme